MSAAWTIITDAITAIMDRSFDVRLAICYGEMPEVDFPLTNGRRPKRSIKNQGMNDAKKNQVFRKPAIRPEVLASKPRLFWNKAPA